MTSEPQPCPALPSGWRRQVVIRQNGASAGHPDVYYISPSGKKCRSKNEMSTCLDGDVDLANFNYRTGHMGGARRSRDLTARQQKRAAAIAKVIAKCNKSLKTPLPPSDTGAAPTKKKRKADDVVSEDWEIHNDTQLVEDESVSHYLGKKLGEEEEEEEDDNRTVLSDPTRTEDLDGSKGGVQEGTGGAARGPSRKTRGPNGKPPVKQPVNAFMLWALNERKTTDNHCVTFIKLLGTRWRSMTAQEKQPWVEEQKRAMKAFKEKYPYFKPTKKKPKKNQGKEPHAGKAKEKKKKKKKMKNKKKKKKLSPPREEEEGQPVGSSHCDPSSSYHKGSTESNKDMLADDDRPQVGNAAPRCDARRPNEPTRKTRAERTVTDADGTGGNVPPSSRAKVAPLSSVRTMNWTFDELRTWIGLQSAALLQSEAQPATDVTATLVRLYWDGCVAALADAVRRYHARPFMGHVEAFCDTHVTADTVVLSHVLCSWSAMREAYCVLDGDYDGGRAEVTDGASARPYVSSWLNVDERLDIIDKEFGFPPSLKCATFAATREDGAEWESETEKDNRVKEEEEEEAMDPGDPLSSLQIHVLPPDKAMALFNQVCSYQTVNHESATADELCEVALDGGSKSDGTASKEDDGSSSSTNGACFVLEGYCVETTDGTASEEDNNNADVRSVLEEYCVKTTDGATPERDSSSNNNIIDIRHCDRSPSYHKASKKSNKDVLADADRLQVRNASQEYCVKMFDDDDDSSSDDGNGIRSILEEYCAETMVKRRSDVRETVDLKIYEEPRPQGRRPSSSSSSPPDESGFTTVDATARLALFGSDNGQREFSGRGITRVNCSQVFFPPRILDVVTVADAPVVAFGHPRRPAFDTG